ASRCSGKTSPTPTSRCHCSRRRRDEGAGKREETEGDSLFPLPSSLFPVPCGGCGMDQFLQVLVVFFGVINPIVNIAIFPTLTHELDARARRATIGLCTLVAFGMLLAFNLAGEAILKYLDISLDSFRVAAGILLGLIALRLVDRGAPTAPSGPPAQSAADL